MDFFAHIFWSIIVYGKFLGFTELVQTIFFSVLPDLLWGVPLFSFVIYEYAKGVNIKKKREAKEYNKKFNKIYGLSHSFVIMAIIFVVLSVIKMQIFYPAIL